MSDSILGDIFIIVTVLILNALGIYIGYCYGKGVIVEVGDDCVIYEERLYCEPERKLQVNFE